MRKIFFLILLFFTCLMVYPETIDSLKAKREKLYEKYSDINIPGKELSKADNEKSVSILKDIIIIDAKIIREFSEFDQKTKEYDSKIISLTKENDSLTKELKSSTDLMLIIYIAGCVIIALLIFSLIFLFIYYIKYSKLKKKTANYRIT